MSISLNAVCTPDRMDVAERPEKTLRPENTVRPENAVRMIGEILPWVLAQYGIGHHAGPAETPFDRRRELARQGAREFQDSR